MAYEPTLSSLSAAHSRELRERSGISDDVAKARGYETVEDKARLRALGFAKFQRRVPALLIPLYGANGEVVGYQTKPLKPRRDAASDKLVKYELPKGSGVVIDVPPGAAAALPEPSVPLWVTEGAKKADAAVTAGLCCIALQGVWSWRDDEFWNGVATQNREVNLAFDSDVMRKDDVKNALDALTDYLENRGARVSWAWFPDGRASIAGEAPQKVGLDDWLVANDMSASSLDAMLRQPDTNIKVNSVSLSDLTRKAIAALRRANVPETLFERDGLMVEARGGGIREVTKDRLMFLLGECASWYRVVGDGAKRKRTAVSPPKDVVANVLAAGPENWAIQRLDRIVTTPVFAGDGSLRTEPGYHGPSRSYYMPPDGLRVRKVSKAPSKKEIREAKVLVDGMLADFVFVDEADKAHAWALLLQPFAREMIRGTTPLFSVQAPRQGTGKTLLVQSTLAPAVGVVDSFSEPHGDEEMEKRLTSVFREAMPVVFFDNVDRFISYASLASALTKPTWSGRVLGASSTVTLPITCSFVLTANNPSFSDDMKRRVVPLRLDAKIEDPSQRTGFTHSLPAWALQNRGELVWAACTVIAAWVAAGRPRAADPGPVLGSFGPWRRVMGGILANAGIPGFLMNLSVTRAEKTTDQENFEAIARFAVRRYGEDCPWKASELAQDMWAADEELDFPKPYATPDQLATLLTYFLRSRKGQVVKKVRLERSASRGKGGFQWYFTRVDGQ